jgi:hypothetical protein
VLGHDLFGRTYRRGEKQGEDEREKQPSRTGSLCLWESVRERESGGRRSYSIVRRLTHCTLTPALSRREREIGTRRTGPLSLREREN